MAEDNYKSCAKSGHEKENFQTEGKLINEDLCFNCKRSLANSQHIINIAGHSRRWHPHCFTCSVCREPMDRKQSCHVFRDQIVCRSDFARLKRDHSIRCARCHWPIAASDWVRRASSHVYHIACFNCDVCLRQLNTGEQFIISSESVLSSPSSPSLAGDGQTQDSQLGVRLLCRLHFTVDPTTTPINKRPRRSSTPTRSAGKKMRASLELECQPTCRLSTPEDYLHLLSTAATTTATTTANSEMISETANELNSLTCPPLSSSISSSSASSTPSSSTMHAHYASGAAGPMTPTGSQSGAPSASSLPCKSKRVRTTFTEDQLSILQTQFQLDSNPDGQDLERIATITGLSKRVTQVWFQNSRARQKKYLIKRKPSGSGGANFTSQSSQDNSQTGSPIGGANGQQNYCLSTYSPHEHPFGGGDPTITATANVPLAEQCNNEARAQWLSSTSSAPISVARNNDEVDDEDSSDESMPMNDTADEDSRDSLPPSLIRNELGFHFLED